MKQQERLKSILVILSIVLIFLASEVIDVIMGRGFKYLLSLVYPSFAFWISLIWVLIIDKKKIINQDTLIKTSILSVLFLWAGSFVMSAMHSPVTTFMPSDKIPFRYQVFRLPAIAIFKAGWFLIVMILIYSRTSKGKVIEEGT